MTGSGEALAVSKDNMGQLKEELQKSMLQMKDFDKLKNQVEMTITQEGLRIELLETESGTFFDLGNSRPTEKGQELLDMLAEEIGKLPNKISIEGSTGLAFTEDVGDRFRAYDWQVIRIEGNNLKDIVQAINIAKESVERPTLIVSRTHIGFGSPNKQDSREAHGEPLGDAEVKLTKGAYGWPTDKTFYVPDESLEVFRAQVELGAQREAEWQQRFDAYAKEFPELAAEWKQWQSGELPEGWDSEIPDFKDAKPLATRNASGEVMNAIAKKLPSFIGGSADLAPSTMTHLKGYGDFEPDNYIGRNFHFGVREHAMGSICNGMAVGKTLIPFGATFLIFSDYQRPTIRLAALMEVQNIFVYTHDSIGLGEDGPTHQAIEQLPSLRTIPNLYVIRPADHTETAEAWRIAIKRKHGPTALALTRQKVPLIDRSERPVEIVGTLHFEAQNLYSQGPSRGFRLLQHALDRGFAGVPGM